MRRGPEGHHPGLRDPGARRHRGGQVDLPGVPEPGADRDRDGRDVHRGQPAAGEAGHLAPAQAGR